MSHMSVQDMIDATPLGPILDTPVVDVLTGLGLPPLPVLPALPPMPGLPPMPPINLEHLIKPITDLLGGFGTGDLSKAGFDPTAIFQSLSKVLETTMTMSKGALDLGDKLWTGQASTSAAAKTVEAGANSGALATQGTGMSFDINTAAAIVGQGLATVQGIIVATVSSIAAVVPIILSPGWAAGITMAIAAANVGLAQATAAVAATRAALLGPTGKMTVNGAKVPVTNAPSAARGATTQSPFAIASSVLSVVSPALSTATELPVSLLKPASKMLDIANRDNTTRTTTADNTRRTHPDPGKRPGGGAKPGGLGGGGVGGLGVMQTLAGARATVPSALSTVENAALNTTTSPARAQLTTQPMPMGGAPLTGAGAGRGAGAAEQHSTPDYLVTEVNGQRVVGDTPEAVPAVLGHDDDPEPEPVPDIELRLGPSTSPTTT